MGGLGPVAEFLTRSGIGTLGIVDHDIVMLLTYIDKAYMMKKI